MIRLLHVEDDLDICELTRMALEICGDFDIVQCHTGREALIKVEEYTPEIILLDMMMPGMTGKETLLKMRKIDRLRSVPAIFMTARAQQIELDELRETGAADVISKPFDPLTLGDQIKAAMQACPLS